jgi:ADP-ribose pyrophosphatase YjhB (NUDIX family)
MSVQIARKILIEYSQKQFTANESQMVQAAISFLDLHHDALWRTCLQGHVTGSAWIVSPDRSKVLLTHHHKLNRWFQLGGHADGDPEPISVSLKEGSEESGLKSLKPVSRELFDFDQHEIPARGDEPAHWHFDFRYMLEADPDEPLQISSESKDLAWVSLDQVAVLNPSESMLRMVRKTALFV